MVKGKQMGPLDHLALSQRVRGGEISVKTYLWKQGMGEWKRAGDLPEMARLFSGSGPTTEMNGSGHPHAPEIREGERRTRVDAPAAQSTYADSGAADPNALIGGELFSDADMPPSERDADASPKKKKKKKKDEPVEDPFAAFPSDPSQGPEPGEATMFFIAQAGVNKRNPPWKIAAFVGALVGIPVLLLFALSTLKIVPLEVTRVDEQGNETTESIFSPKGMAGLGDLLTGNKPAKKKKPESAGNVARGAKTLANTTGKPTAGTRDDSFKMPTTTGPTEEELARLYAGKQDKGPRVRTGMEVRAKDTATGGLSQEASTKVVTQTQPAFQACIEQTLRKNPNFRGGKIDIIATVGSSGVVKKAEIDRKDIDLSDLGSCLKGRAKRMQFPAFAGDEETEIHIPLILTATL